MDLIFILADTDLVFVCACSDCSVSGSTQKPFTVLYYTVLYAN